MSATEYILYQANPSKQMLLYDMATSSSVLTFLKMHKIHFTIKNQTNTEFMSENGRLPVVIERGHDKPMCGFKEVFWQVSRSTNYVPSLLELAYIDWIETKFLEAEYFICWCHEPVLSEYTKNRYTYDLPWPVSSILLAQKKKSIRQNFKDFPDFIEKFNRFLVQLSKLIGNKSFCTLSPSASAVNALIYGHSNAIMSTKLHQKLVESITWQKRITGLVKLVEEHYPS